MSASRRVLIVGGGIGGLTAALRLHQRGIQAIICERERQIQSNMGLGINLLPHCTQVLHELGLEKALSESSVRTSTLMLAGNKGLHVWSEDRGLEAGHSTPQYSIHRGALADLLGTAVLERLGSDQVKSGYLLKGLHGGRLADVQNTDWSSVDPTVEPVIAEFETDGKLVEMEVDAVIGADGLKSVVRQHFYKDSPKFTGWVCWRGSTLMPPLFDGRTMVIQGKIQGDRGEVMSGKHSGGFIFYPMTPPREEDGHQQMNWVAEVKIPLDREPGAESWTVEGDRHEAASHFADWEFMDFSGEQGLDSLQSLNAREVIESAQQCMKFVVYDRDPVARWSFGRVTLIGDAAHPMLPFGSQGAGQAILDAAALADALADTTTNAATSEGDGVVQAFQRYETERLQAANKVVEATRKGGDHYPFDLVCQKLEGQVIAADGLQEVLPQEEIQHAREEYIKTAGYALKK